MNPRVALGWGAALGVAAMVVIGAIVFAAGGAHFGSGNQGTAAATGSSTAPISLPERLGSFEDTVTVARRHGSANAASTQQRVQEDAKRLTVAAYSAAYGGAAAVFRGYSDAALQHSVSVIAVRAHSPGLTVGPVANPADLGLAVNQREVHAFGDVTCVVNDTNLTAAGAKVDPSALEYSPCQRTGPHLTVAVFGNLMGEAGRRDAVALTDSAYSAAGGG